MQTLYKRPGTKEYRISQVEENGEAAVRATASSLCFNDLVGKLDEFSVTDLRLLIQNEDEAFNPDFYSFTNRHALRRLAISAGSSNFSELSQEFDFSILSDFRSLYSLEVMGLHFAAPALNSLPMLRKLFLTWKENRVVNLGQKCPGLQWARLDGFKGRIDDLGSLENLTSLRLYEASLSTIEGVADIFPQLETLVIEGQKRELDVTPLAACQRLKHLKFDGFSKAGGIDALNIPTLEMAYLTKLTRPDFFEINSQLSFMRVKSFEGEPTPSMIERGWGKVGREFGTGDGFIPELLRK